MKKALLLHGREWTNDWCWFPWLKDELESRWYIVSSPNLPNTKRPVFNEQIADIEKYAENFWEWDIIVWHSLWCGLATQFIEKYNLQKVDAILIAPVYPKLSEEIKEKLWKSYDSLKWYFWLENTFAKLDTNYTIFLSDNDPFITMESATKYYDNFALQNNNSIKYRKFHNMYHFSDWAPEPIKKIPEILEYIK